MKLNHPIYQLFVILTCSACITEFEAKIDEVANILVVEGIITDDESIITLNRSKGLSYEDNIKDMSPYHVTDAKVYIECDDGTQWGATDQNSGKYTIQTGKLNIERQYRLKIESEEHIYHSEFASPMIPPEIDSVFWIKQGQYVKIYVASHDPDSTTQFYRWTFQEVWTYTSNLRVFPDDNPFYPDGFPFFCWDRANNTGLLLGSSEKTVSGKITSQLTEILPWDDRLSILYRIEVGQHVIGKRAYKYFDNIKKNARQTGSLFARIPSDVIGNIICTTDRSRMVIGHVDVSSATRKKLYISTRDIGGYYDPPKVDYCDVLYPYMLSYPYYYQLYGGKIPESYIVWQWEIIRQTNELVPTAYVDSKCVDCTLKGGTTQKPEDWHDQY